MTGRLRDDRAAALLRSGAGCGRGDLARAGRMAGQGPGRAGAPKAWWAGSGPFRSDPAPPLDALAIVRLARPVRATVGFALLRLPRSGSCIFKRAKEGSGIGYAIEDTSHMPTNYRC